MTELNARICLRNDTLSHWLAANPILKKGEVAVVYDPNTFKTDKKIRFKVGDGITRFADLAWASEPTYNDREEQLEF